MKKITITMFAAFIFIFAVLTACTSQQADDYSKNEYPQEVNSQEVNPEPEQAGSDELIEEVDTGELEQLNNDEAGLDFEGLDDLVDIEI